MKAKIKVGYLISYDYIYLMNSLESIYKYVDLIVLCYDKDFKTWTGNTFNIPETFFESIKKFDTKNKIKFYSDSFYVEENISNPMKSETLQRNKLGEFMGSGGWHIQLDVDEYVYDFKKMLTYLKKSAFLLKDPINKPYSLIAQVIVLYKKDENGFYVINPINEDFYFATNNPKYIRARQTNWTCLYTDQRVLHQSWARDEHEIKQKLDNWGHKNDFNGEEYFKKWKNININNYEKLIDFHPVEPKVWHKLVLLKYKDVKSLIKNASILFPQPHTYSILLNLKKQMKLPFLLKIELKIKKFLFEK